MPDEAGASGGAALDTGAAVAVGLINSVGNLGGFLGPRVLGYVFNPITVVYCYAGDTLVAMLYEVNNTFGGRHCYLLPVQATGARVIRHGCDKAFHVSPFMDMDLTYAFAVAPPPLEPSLTGARSSFERAIKIDPVYFPAVASLAGQFSLERWALRPTCSPHHSASAVALVEIGRAHV